MILTSVFSMFKLVKIFCFLLCLISLTSCIELIDDITINSDGSGKFKYSINLSSSKTKVNSIISLDSLDGYKVPKTSELKQKILQFEKIMSSQPGISNVKIESNWEDFIFKFNCDFDNLHNLQTAFKVSLNSMNSGLNVNPEVDWISLSGNCLVRDIPEFINTQLYNSRYVKDEELRSAKYTSITRFDKEVTKFDNSLTVLSKNKKAVMVQTDLKTLLDNPNKLDDKIYILN